RVVGILGLHQAPMIGQIEGVEDRTTLCGIAIEDAMQVIRRQAISEGLGTRPIVDLEGLLVVPGLVGVAGLDRRDDMDQAGMPATRRQDFGDDLFLANDDLFLANIALRD